jgi:two-component sensor histidine kinase/PAS domain-containing protein
MNKNILLVEDDAVIAMAQQLNLEEYGYRVIWANNSSKTLDIISKNNSIDLILMDIDLGEEIDGTETAKIILKDWNIPLIFLSSHTDPEIVERTERISSYGYVVKNSGITVLDVSIKMAFKLFDAIEEKRLSEANYSKIINSMSDKFQLIELIYDKNGKAIDYFYLNVNPAFEKLTNKTAEQIIGKRAKDLFGIVEDHWIEIYSEVEKTGNPCNYENYGAELDKSYHINACKVDDKKIAIIFSDITEQKRKGDELKRQLSEKEILLREVHHRIKNNISSIEGQLFIQASLVTNTESAIMLKDIRARVSCMRTLYEKLLISDNYNDISVSEYLNSLIDTILSLFPNKSTIKIDKQIVNFKLRTKTLFPLGIIINELLTNVMKYSFENDENLQMTIVLVNVNNQITLTIQDNGQGLAEDFDIDKSTGFGLSLVQLLTLQLNGQFTLENHNGTRSTLKFPYTF